MVLEKKELSKAARPRFPRATSYGALFRAAEKALRTEQDDHDQQEERDGGAVLRGPVGRDEIVDDAEDEAASDRAAHLVEAAHDRRDERDQPKRLAVGELGEVNR